MSGNWFRASVIGLIFFLLSPAAASAQGEARSTTATLDTVVVTASRTEEKLREVTSSVTVITEKDIKKSTAKNMGQLMSQNGFQTYDNGGGTSTMYIRGIGGSSMTSAMDFPILFMINGQRTGSINLSLMGLGNVERVEIIRGPAAIQYGPAAMGGVVNIITKRGQEGASTAMMEVGAGSFGRFDQKLAFSGAGANGVDFSAALAKTKNDDYKTGGGETWRHTRTDGRLGMDLDLGYTFVENHRLGVHFNYFDIKGDQLPASGWPDTKSGPIQYGSNNNFINNTAFSYEGATEEKLLSWNVSYITGRSENKGSSYEERGYPYSYQSAATAIYEPDKYSVFNTEAGSQQTQANVTYDNGLVALTTGLELMTSDYESFSKTFTNTRAATVSKYKTEDYGAYLLGKLRLMDESLIFTAGGRYDKYKNSSQTVASAPDISNSNWVPSLGVAWLPVDLLKLRANYSEGFRLPSASQILGNGTTLWPNKDLKPETSKNYEFGADLNWNFVNANLTYFRTDVENKVASLNNLFPTRPDGGSTSGNPRGGQNQNLEGTATYAGLEFGLNAGVGQALDWGFNLTPYASLTWMTTRKQGDKRSTVVVLQDKDVLPNVPEYLAAYGLTFEHEGIGLSSTLNASYFGTRWAMDYSNAHNSTYGNDMYKKFGGFTVVDFSLDKRLWDFEDKGKLGLRAEINNLMNHDYALNMDYPMPGRNFYLGLAYNY